MLHFAAAAFFEDSEGVRGGSSRPLQLLSRLAYLPADIASRLRLKKRGRVSRILSRQEMY
jgi:hypothetical protein